METKTLFDKMDKIEKQFEETEVFYRIFADRILKEENNNNEN